MKQLFRKGLHLVAVMATMVALSGCNLVSLSSFVLKDAKILSFDLSKGATVEMTIENLSPFKATVVGGELAAQLKGEPIGEVFMRNSVVLPKRSTSKVVVEVGMRFASPIAALKALGTLTSSPDKITISGYGEGKIWLFRKRFERHDVPISEFISIFGSPSDYFEN